jgi:hypothetical protein
VIVCLLACLVGWLVGWIVLFGFVSEPPPSDEEATIPVDRGLVHKTVTVPEVRTGSLQYGL